MKKSKYNISCWNSKFSDFGKYSLVEFYREILKNGIELGKPCVGIRKRLAQITKEVWRF